MDAPRGDQRFRPSPSGATDRRPRTAPVGAARIAVALCAAACTRTYDAGSNRPHGLLPVDERNPLVLLNDGAFDNWGTEYAVLLGHDGGPKLAGIVVGTSGPWPDLETNVAGVRELVLAARDSGLGDVPDPIASVGDVLERPASGEIDETPANRSEGARFIVETSRELARSYRPLVVATGGRLTDVADAYLLDPSVTERVVVVASLGSLSASGAVMGEPNGEMDPWADAIVTARFRYVQVSAFYDQLEDIPAARVEELPDNPFGAWLAAKQPSIWSIPEAADQVAVAAVGIPDFVTEVARVAPAGTVESGATEGPALEGAPDGPGWLVRQVVGSAATNRFWSILGDPSVFAP